MSLLSTSGPAVARLPRDEDAAVAAELADLLYRSPRAILANLLITLLVAGGLAYRLHQPLPFVWGISIAGLCAIRAWLWRLYRTHRRDPDFAPELWLRRFTFFAAATACHWGSLATAIVLLGQAPIDVFIPIVIVGLAAGLAAGSTAYVPAVDAFLWPATAPLILASLRGGDLPHFALAALYFTFILNLSLMARRSHATLVRALRDKLEKEDAAAQLQAASLAKTQFLATMSHELRTPLNSIIGFSEIIGRELLGPAGNPKYVEYASDLQATGQHLLQLVDDILDLAKIDAGRLHLREEEDVAVPDLIESCLRMVAPRAATQGVRLAQDIAAEAGSIRGDATRLRQILLNLLSNSIKFTPRGGTVTVRARRQQDRLALEVADTGIGIAAADLPLVMEPFGQATAPGQHRDGGSGLGLPLTKRLVELHGGSFDIRSDQGVGTVVRLVLPVDGARTAPLARAVEPAAEEPPAPAIAYRASA